MTIQPYLAFNGFCEEAFDFYKSVLGGEFQHVSRFSEMPPEMCEEPIKDEDKNKIMHISLLVDEQTTIMGSDVVENENYPFKAGNNFSLSINAKSKEDAERLFNALSKGGKIMMPLEKTFWNAFFGMFVDKFGIQWMVNYPLQEK